MIEGYWLTINFDEEEATKILKFIQPEYNLTSEILCPLKLYSEEV
jgi:hypothetical protein